MKTKSLVDNETSEGAVMSRKAVGVLLTEAEFELMTFLWELEKGTVREVLELREMKTKGEAKPMAYTSASTIIRILEQKNIVESIKEGKTHIYSPILTKKEYEEKTLHHMVEKVFDRRPSSLVKSLIGSGKISENEKKELKKLLKGL